MNIQVISKTGRNIILAICGISAFVLSASTPSKVGMPLTAGSAQNVTADPKTHVLVVPNATQFYTANPPPSSGSMTPDEVAAALANARQFPIFTIPLKIGFSDVILKASLVNFSAGVSTTERAMYEFDSYDPTLPQSDPNMIVLFTIPTSGYPADDPRETWQQVLTGPLKDQINEAPQVNAIILEPSKCAGSEDWMYEGNVELHFAYALVNASGEIEQDLQGREKWTTIIPTWASNRKTGEVPLE